VSKKQLRWRKQPRERGLASICQTPRGATLRYGDDVAGRVMGTRTKEGTVRYFWVAGWDRQEIPRMNTCGEMVKSLEEAKAACKAYVVEHLKRD